MKSILIISVYILLFGQALLAQKAGCPKNPDPLYDRKEILQKFADNLNRQNGVTGAGFHIKDDRPMWFNIFDLTDFSNQSFGAKCVDFIDGHIYHFSPRLYDQSESSIAILEAGKIRFFERINCGDIDTKLKEVIAYVKQISGKYNITETTLQRVANYRRYAAWNDVDILTNIYGCEVTTKLPERQEGAYNRYDVLKDMSGILFKHIKDLSAFNFFSVENERAIGFYVRDLVNLENKQTNLLEFVHFKEGHVYQFGWIDAPYSNTHIVVLKDGKIHTFEAIDCKPKEAGINKLIDFIKENFKEENTKKELLKRVENYKRYRAIIEFQGKTEPECSTRLRVKNLSGES